MTRSAYHPHERVSLTFDPDKGRTKQSFAADCDINQIMRHWRNSGQIVHVNETPPTYGDFSDVDSYLEAQSKVLLAQSDFDNLPAAVRDRLGNDPGQLISFLANPDNLIEAEKLGLLTIAKPSEEPEAAQADPVSSPPESGSGSPISGGE